MAEEGERVKEQLALFLGSIPGLLAFDDFLPKQRGEVVHLELRRHQREALEAPDAETANQKLVGRCNGHPFATAGRIDWQRPRSIPWISLP